MVDACRTVFHEEMRTFEVKRTVLRKDLADLNRKSQMLTDRLLDGTLSSAEYRVTADRLAAQKNQLQSDLESLGDGAADLAQFEKFCDARLINLASLWDHASPTDRTTLRTILFEDTLIFSKEGGLSSNSVSPILFNQIYSLSETWKEWCALRDSNSRPSGS